jgi:hypothetical protein
MANETVVLDRAAFKSALQRMVNDQDFARELESKPAAALKSIGVDLPPEVATELDKRPLSQTIEQSFARQPGDPVAVIPIPIVIIGVHVGVTVAVATRVKTRDAELDQAITDAAEASSHLKLKE